MGRGGSFFVSFGFVGDAPFVKALGFGGRMRSGGGGGGEFLFPIIGLCVAAIVLIAVQITEYIKCIDRYCQ